MLSVKKVSPQIKADLLYLDEDACDELWKCKERRNNSIKAFHQLCCYALHKAPTRAWTLLYEKHLKLLVISNICHYNKEWIVMVDTVNTFKKSTGPSLLPPLCLIIQKYIPYLACHINNTTILSSSNVHLFTRKTKLEKLCSLELNMMLKS